MAAAALCSPRFCHNLPVIFVYITSIKSYEAVHIWNADQLICDFALLLQYFQIITHLYLTSTTYRRTTSLYAFCLSAYFFLCLLLLLSMDHVSEINALKFIHLNRNARFIFTCILYPVHCTFSAANYLHFYLHHTGSATDENNDIHLAFL